MDTDIALGIKWYLIFLWSMVCHEAAHAWAAYKLGDSTAYEGGQVSLDPWPHLKREPIGMVAVPIVTFLLNGWMMGWASAPFRIEWARLYPRRAALMAMAGPAANIFLVLLAILFMRLGLEWNFFQLTQSTSMTHFVVGETELIGFLATLVSLLFSLNLLLAIFNLLPFPPLDGASLPLLFLSESQAESYSEWTQHPMLALVGLLVAWKVFPLIYWPLQSGIETLLLRWL